MPTFLLALLVLAVAGPCAAEDPSVRTNPMLPEPVDLMENVPQDFPRFYLRGREREAQLLSRYLWYHFANRGGNSKTLFNKEYLTTADLWAAGATDERRKKSIQEVHREDILGMRLDEEGYVHTHQHFSHAHEHGWPFPLWTQADAGPDKVAGKTAGWHFQNDGPGWVWGYLKGWNRGDYFGETAAQLWELENARSLGIEDGKWRIESTGESPAIITPEGAAVDSFQSPFLQLRWTRTGEPKDHARPCVEWLCEGDTEFGADRRAYFDMAHEEHEGVTGSTHSMIEMYRHPKWQGKIKRIRISLAPGESDVKFGIDSFFTVYDTRHSINNPIFIFACWDYFRWTGDLDFLRANVNRMRRALRYQQTAMGGLEHSHIRNTWPGHDGLAGWTKNPDGSKTVHGGHGIGNNYWDILPFGWDDMYATSQYYAATLAMAEVEDAILADPGWDIPRGALALDPAELRRHAAAVKAVANRKFWNEKQGRFVACIDKDGMSYDYGFTFLNLDAIWYDIASDEHARRIMDWIAGRRTVEGDTSTGDDIYHWRFGPRATTKRNIEWYGQAWTGPEGIPFGGQVQDGGAVLGFSFYDLWARLHVLGPDDAWDRLAEILRWEEEVISEGGYREYYEDGKRGTTLQGGGTAGGIGIDHEFFESSLLPSIVTYGFLGLDPGAADLSINPRLPKACPEMGVGNILYRNVRMDVKASSQTVSIEFKDRPLDPIRIKLAGNWKLNGRTGSAFELVGPGVYEFVKQ